MKKLIPALCLLVMLLSACYDPHPQLCKPVSNASAEASLPKNQLEPPAPAPAQDPETTKKNVTGSEYLTDIENQVMDLINKERLSLGLTELELDPRLQNAARIRSKELCQDENMRKKKLSHTRPDGSGWQTVLTKDIPIVGLVEAGEILARENTTNGSGSSQEPIPAKDWFLLWKSSEPHYNTITWPEAQRIGVGIYYQIENGDYYTNATVLFGRYRPEEAPASKNTPPETSVEAPTEIKPAS